MTIRGLRLSVAGVVLTMMTMMATDAAWAAAPHSTTDSTTTPTVVIGVTPIPPDASSVYVMNPVLEASKLWLAGSAETAIAEDMALGVNQPVPSDPQRIPGGGGGRGRPPSSAQVALAQHPQLEPTWCVPATVQVMLSTPTFNVTVSQASLAAEMHTSPSTGTYFPNAVAALNSHEASFRYVADDSTSSAADLVSRVASDVYFSGVPVGMAGQASVLPWWIQRGWSGYHAITGYGYWTQSGGGVLVYDSIAQFPGPYRATAGQAYAFIEGNYSGVPNLIW